MASGENRANNTPEIKDDLAKDVANLYSWAQVEGVPYRDFSRQRRTRHVRRATDIDIRKSEAVTVPDMDIESQVQAIQSTLVRPSDESRSSASAPAIQSAPDVSQPTALPTESIQSFIVSEPSPPTSDEGVPPSVAIYSLAGGVGKTTLCANLGRIFCAMKEKLLLVDASGSGLLPFYFGATDLRSGLRTFLAPDATYPPLHVIGADEVTKQWLENDVKAAMGKVNRTLFDLGNLSKSLLKDVFGMCGTILVPLLPDLNSLLTLSRIEVPLKAMQADGIATPEVFYILNQFDEEDPIDQQARALVERQCGERVLPLTVRSSEEVAKAIASRMTVADHAPRSAVTHDYLEIASWVRKRAPVRAGPEMRTRWSEQ